MTARPTTAGVIGTLIIASVAGVAQAAPGVAQAAPAVADDIRDIRGPVPLPMSPPWGTYAAIAAGALVLALIAWRAYHWYRSRRATPYQLATARLRAAAAMIEQGHGAAFAEAVSDAVRAYIEARFALRATHETTEEFLSDLLARADAVPALAAHRDVLTAFLAHCDLAKFAGRGMSTSLMQELLASATTLIEHTNDALLAQRTPRLRLRRASRTATGATS